ncbi:membrane protein [Candidatus Magnetoovum chiemensis]|nr:membrane protein [Candidatus Magnetoovum chiemensis]
MVKRSVSINVLLITALVLCTIGISYGSDISFTLPCSGGGERSAVGDYNPLSGVFFLNYNINNCVIGLVTFNGALTSSGIFMINTQTTAQVDINTTVSVTASSVNGAGSVNCSGNSDGTYNFAAQYIDGASSINCSSSGSMTIDLNSLLTGSYIYY